MSAFLRSTDNFRLTSDHKTDMRAKSITTHLKPYRMLASRRTTINHMFAAAVAPHDIYDEEKVRAAVTLLGNDPDGDLTCAYCGDVAETWDHVFATVRNSRFSGHGHRLGNLLPCCKPCNSRKGNKSWESYLESLPLTETEHATRFATIGRYLATYERVEAISSITDDHEKLDAIRMKVLELVAEGDEIAGRIREQAKPT